MGEKMNYEQALPELMSLYFHPKSFDEYLERLKKKIAETEGRISLVDVDGFLRKDDTNTDSIYRLKKHGRFKNENSENIEAYATLFQNKQMTESIFRKNFIDNYIQGKCGLNLHEERDIADKYFTTETNRKLRKNMMSILDETGEEYMHVLWSGSSKMWIARLLLAEPSFYERIYDVIALEQCIEKEEDVFIYTDDVWQRLDTNEKKIEAAERYIDRLRNYGIKIPTPYEFLILGHSLSEIESLERVIRKPMIFGLGKPKWNVKIGLVDPDDETIKKADDLKKNYDIECEIHWTDAKRFGKQLSFREGGNHKEK